MIEWLRYGLAWLTLASVPAAVLYWYVVHPFIGFWRRVGKVGTFSAMALLFVLNLLAAWYWRQALLPPAPPPSVTFVVIGIAAYVGAGVLQRIVQRQLSFRVLAGTPELDADGRGGELLDRGIYAHIRHPRYVSITLGILGVAFLVDYPAVWVMWLLMVPTLYGIVLLEEKELVQRFGDRYVEYARRVPRFVPRFRRS